MKMNQEQKKPTKPKKQPPSLRAARVVHGPGLVAKHPDTISSNLGSGDSAPGLGSGRCYYGNDNIRACASPLRDWSNANPWTHWWFLKSSWSWVLQNGLWQCFPSSTNIQTGKKRQHIQALLSDQGKVIHLVLERANKKPQWLCSHDPPCAYTHKKWGKKIDKTL